MKTRLLLGVGCVFLFIFYFFSRQVNQGFLKQTDFDATVKLQERIDTSSRLRLANAVGTIFEGSTFFASPEVSVIIIVFLTIVAFIDIKNRKIRWSAILIPMLFGLLVLGEVYGKSVVHHPAPPFFMIKNPATLFPKYYINDQFSYPSGHAARAVFIGIVLYTVYGIRYTVYRKKTLSFVIAIGIICYVSLVSISRIYLGHHWLSDIIGGGLLGGGLGFIVIGGNTYPE